MTEQSGADEPDEPGRTPDEEAAGSQESTAPESAPEPPASATRPVGWLPIGAEALFGTGARAEEAYGLLTVDVPPGSWISTLRAARDDLGLRFFDWLSAVDEPGTGFQVCAHLVGLPVRPVPGVTGGRGMRALLLRTTVPHEAPALPTATPVFAGAAWHERETHEMFGVVFTGHPGLTPLLLPETFEGHPLRKDFVLAARVAKAWPGAVEPGESAHGAPKRRQMLPPGVPDPNEWGPLKGQLPPVPSRPARGRAGRSGAATGTGAGPGERPARRARSASAGSASQRGETETPDGSGSQDSGSQDSGSQGSGATGSDAPWHAARPSTPDKGEGGTGAAEENGSGDGDGDGNGESGDGTGDGPKGGA